MTGGIPIEDIKPGHFDAGYDTNALCPGFLRDAMHGLLIEGESALVFVEHRRQPTCLPIGKKTAIHLPSVSSVSHPSGAILNSRPASMIVSHR